MEIEDKTNGFTWLKHYTKLTNHSFNENIFVTNTNALT